MRVFTYAFIITGIMALLYVGGFHDLPTGNAIATLVSDGVGSIFSLSLYTTLYVLLLSFGTGGVVIAGLFGRNVDTKLLEGVMIGGFLLMFMEDLLWLYGKFDFYDGFYKWVGILIFAPLIVGFLISIRDWWNGTD